MEESGNWEHQNVWLIGSESDSATVVELSKRTANELHILEMGLLWIWTECPTWPDGESIVDGQ